MALNEKRHRFVDEYLIDMNASQAAIRAGYSCHRANQTGYFLMTNVDIKKEIDRKMIEKAEKLDISREKILSLLMGEALNSENKGSERVAALSHLGRFTLGELHRNENTDVTFQWMDEGDDVADVSVLTSYINRQPRRRFI